MRFSDEHVKMIRATVPDCPEEDFQRFIFTAERLELDPLLRQIQLIPRRGKDSKGAWHTSFETLLGRDSYRILADRTGEVDGSETVLSFDEGKLVSATAVIYRKGKSHPFRETVYLQEYIGTFSRDGKEEISSFWKSKPITMLGKVAEAQALRKAFPVLLSGLYSQDEMEAPVDRETGEILESQDHILSPPALPSHPKNSKATLPSPLPITQTPAFRALMAWRWEAEIEEERFKDFLHESGVLPTDEQGELHWVALSEANLRGVLNKKEGCLARFRPFAAMIARLQAEGIDREHWRDFLTTLCPPQDGQRLSLATLPPDIHAVMDGAIHDYRIWEKREDNPVNLAICPGCGTQYERDDFEPVEMADGRIMPYGPCCGKRAQEEEEKAKKAAATA